MLRSRTIAFVLALALAPGAALAQPVIAADRRPAPPAEPAAEALPAVEIPPPPEALRARAAALGAVVAQTDACYTSHDERAEHTADPRCGRWYASLLRGGDAAAYALGEALRGPQTDPSDGPWLSTAWLYQRGPRLVQVLAGTGSPLAPLFLVRYVTAVAAAAERFDEPAREALRQLTRLAGHDAAPVAPWNLETANAPEARRDIARRWIRWWEGHRDLAPAARLAAGAARAQAELASPDPAVRFAAMQSLATLPGRRGEVAAAARLLLADASLPAPAATLIARWARRQRLPVPSTVARERSRALD